MIQDKKEAVVKGSPGGRGNFFQGAGNFFRETWAEMKKVSWPDPPKVVRSTIVVLVIVVAVGLFVAVLDYIFTQALHLSLNLAKNYK